MSNLLIALQTQDGKPWASSLQVAEHFEKRHDNVVRDFRVLRSEAEQINLLNFEEIAESDSFSESLEKTNQTQAEDIDFFVENFREAEYVDGRGRTYTQLFMTEAGFSLLAMGFTGAKALRWKIKYIQAFETMRRRPASAPLPDYSPFILERQRREAEEGTPVEMRTPWLSFRPDACATMTLNGRSVRVSAEGWLNLAEAVAASENVDLPQRGGRGRPVKSPQSPKYPHHAGFVYDNWLRARGGSIGEEERTGRLRWEEPTLFDRGTICRPWICPERTEEFLGQNDPALLTQVVRALSTTSTRIASSTTAKTAGYLT